MRTRNAFTLVVLTIAGLMFTGCYKPWNRIEGNYNVETETRNYSGFKRVFNEGNFDVYIIQDASDEVIIEAESNLIPFIRTRIEGSALVIDTKDNLRNNFPMKIFVHTNEIEEVRLSGSGIIHAEGIVEDEVTTELSGSGDIFFSGTAGEAKCSISGSGSIDLAVECNKLTANISGSGDIEVWGTANRGDFKISGSGSVRGYDLILKECYATISGSGNMYLTVENYLNVNISGSGSIYYMGSPAMDINISGSGSVIHP